MSSGDSSGRAMNFPTILKWMGYGTAILSFVAGVSGVVKVVSDRAEARRQVESLLASEQIQLDGHDYAAAWQTLERAAKVDAGSVRVQKAQEDLAMAWLENIRAEGDQRFSDITEKVDPALTRGITAAKMPARRADLMAHLGWSYFLRSREGAGGLDPAASYADAVRNDPNNPYAEAMWGHWILWNNGDAIAEAERHFSNALASNRQRSFVRGMQISALLNRHDDATEEEVVRVADDIRKEGGSISPDVKRRIFSMYYGKLIPPDQKTADFVRAVPPAEHLATFRWLFDSLELPDSESMLRQGYLSILEEAGGQVDEARKGYDALRKKLAGQPGSLLTAAETGSRRLGATGR
jgi:hypothetical protein